MADKTFTIRNYYERDLPLDDGMESESTGETTIPLRIRRFTVAQLRDFQRGFDRVNNPASARFIYRKPDADEQARRELPKGGWEFELPDSEIRRRRISEMTPEVAAAYEQQQQEDDEFMTSFCEKAITEHIWLDPSVKLSIEREDGTTVEVTNGAGLVEAFGGNLSMLIRLAWAINHENTLTPEEKKRRRLLLASIDSLPNHNGEAAAAGPKPAATASSADSSASVKSADVSVDQDRTLSGSGVSGT